MNHGLASETVSTIREVLARFSGVERAVLFGSRAKGVHRPGSDIDLALTGAGLGWRVLGEIEQALDDGMLPYRFSLVALNGKTDPAIAAHIQRVGVEFYTRAGAGVR